VDALLQTYFTLTLPSAKVTVVPVMVVPRPELAYQKDVDPQNSFLLPDNEADRLRFPSLTLQKSFGFDLSEGESNALLRDLELSRDGNLMKVVQIPRWIRVPYQMDFEAKWHRDINEFIVLFNQKFPRKVISSSIELPDHPGRWRVDIIWEPPLVDNSDLEGLEQERRLRLTASLQVEMPLQFTPEWARTVRKVLVDAYVQQPGDAEPTLVAEIVLQEG